MTAFVLLFSPSLASALNKSQQTLNISGHNFPPSGDCSSLKIPRKNTDWTEHTGRWNKYLDSVLATHFNSPLSSTKSPVYFTLIPVYVDRGIGVYSWREIVWTVSRTEQASNYGKNKNCFLNGTVVAYYVELKNKYGWPPQMKILSKPESEENSLREGKIGLIELRWFDPIGEKRHRWFNHRLASFLQWTGEYLYSPIFLPRVINSLD